MCSNNIFQAPRDRLLDFLFWEFHERPRRVKTFRPNRLLFRGKLCGIWPGITHLLLSWWFFSLHQRAAAALFPPRWIRAQPKFDPTRVYLFLLPDARQS